MYAPPYQMQQHKHHHHMIMLVVVVVIILATIVSLPLVIVPAMAVGAGDATFGAVGSAAIGRNMFGDIAGDCTPF